jgi:hypothetical protein
MLRVMYLNREYTFEPNGLDEGEWKGEDAEAAELLQELTNIARETRFGLGGASDPDVFQHVFDALVDSGVPLELVRCTNYRREEEFDPAVRY